MRRSVSQYDIGSMVFGVRGEEVWADLHVNLRMQRFRKPRLEVEPGCEGEGLA